MYILTLTDDEAELMAEQLLARSQDMLIASKIDRSHLKVGMTLCRLIKKITTSFILQQNKRIEMIEKEGGRDV